MKRKIWSGNSWEEYLSWQNEDRKTLKKINTLIMMKKIVLSTEFATMIQWKFPNAKVITATNKIFQRLNG